MVAARRFQHAFGRSIQTKVLDAVLNHGRQGINIREVSRLVRQSYVYTTLIVKSLAQMGLVLKERQGVDVILRANLEHPVIRWMSEQSRGKRPASSRGSGRRPR